MMALKDRLDLQVIEIDVTSDQQVAEGVAQAELAAGGGIDVLVNNAGIGITSPIEVQDMEATHLIFETNVFGPHRMARAVLPGMRKRGAGQIIQISSQLGCRTRSTSALSNRAAIPPRSGSTAIPIRRR